MRLQLFLPLLFVLPGVLGAQTGTLHALLLVDEFSEIAPACMADKIKIEGELELIAQKTRMQLQKQVLPYNKVEVMEAIREVEADSNDVIFFFFTGHGYRYTNQIGCGDFPYLYITKEQEDLKDAGLCLEWVSNELRKKGARLVITMGDCCNNILPYDEPVPLSSTFTSESYKRLFLLSEGYVLSSSSLPGEFSYATTAGGYYTNSFLGALKEATNPEYSNEMNWEKLLSSIRVKTIIASGGRQKPQFKAETNLQQEIQKPGSVILPVRN